MIKTLIGAFYDNGTQYSGLFTATRSASKIGVEVYDKKTIIETTYSGDAITQATQTPGYVVGTAVNYHEGQTIYLTRYESPTVTVKISEVSSSSVRGTFSGTLKLNGKADFVVTHGKILVPIGNIAN